MRQKLASDAPRVQETVFRAFRMECEGQSIKVNYSAFRPEMLAVYDAINQIYHAVQHRYFTFSTYHKPLTYVLDTKSDLYCP